MNESLATTTTVTPSIQTLAPESIAVGPQLDQRKAQTCLIEKSPWIGLSSHRDWPRSDRHRKRVVEETYEATLEWLHVQYSAVPDVLAPAMYRASIDDQTGAEKPMDAERIVAKMFEGSLEGLPSLPGGASLAPYRDGPLNLMVAAAQQQLAPLFKATVSAAEYVVRDFSDCGLGGTLAYEGPWKTNFNYGRNRFVTDILDRKSHSETVEQYQPGLFVHKTTETITTDTETTVETRSIAENHNRTLIGATREAWPFAGVPKRVKPVADAIPFYLREQSYVFSSDRYVMELTEEQLSQCVETLREQSIDVRVKRNVNRKTLRKIAVDGSVALVAGVGVTAAIAATVILIPIGLALGAMSLIGTATPHIDPCIAVGPWVVAGWAPGEK